jgi:hypothetical protein
MFKTKNQKPKKLTRKQSIVEELNRVIGGGGGKSDSDNDNYNYRGSAYREFSIGGSNGENDYKFIRYDESYIIFNIQQIIIKWRLLLSDPEQNLITISDKDLENFFTEIGFLDDFKNSKKTWSKYLTDVLLANDKDFFIFCVKILGVKSHYEYINLLFNKAIDNFEAQLNGLSIDDVVKNLKSETIVPVELIKKLQKIKKNANRALEIIKKINTSKVLSNASKVNKTLDNEKILTNSVKTDNADIIEKIFDRLKKQFDNVIAFNKLFANSLKLIIELSTLLNSTII